MAHVTGDRVLVYEVKCNMVEECVWECVCGGCGDH